MSTVLDTAQALLKRTARKPGRPVRVAIAGLGAAARQIHLPALAQLGEVTLVGGADPSAEARRWFEKARRGTAYADAAAMIDAERPDWVVVATPPAGHLPVCLAALARGAHVFCEKPLVEHSRDGEALLHAERASGRRVVVNHEFPSMPVFACARSLVENGELGDIAFLQLWEHQLEVPHGGDDWRSQCLTMREFGTHVVDLAVRLYGAYPERIYARMSRGGGAPGSDLVDVVTLDFPGGRLASIVIDRVCPGEHRYLEMRADGRRGSLRASIGGRAGVRLRLDPRARRPRADVDFALGGLAWIERGSAREVVARNSGSPFADATAVHFARAVAAVDAGQDPPVSAAYALDIVRIVDAAYESAASGAPVRFPEEATWNSARLP